MNIALIANDRQVMELIGETNSVESLVIVNDISKLSGADCIIDLLFEKNEKRITRLKESGATTVIINSVTSTLDETDKSFIRIAGWNTLLKRSLVEAATIDEKGKAAAETAFSILNKKIQWLPDQPGFVSCRVISQIINEAYFTLEEDVTGREQIDVAMKLGTNYPFGPFEWAKTIGLNNIVDLLKKLSEKEVRYAPCKTILTEAGR